MHPDEIRTNATLVRGLIASQFPGWADLSISEVDSLGTENVLYRLGDRMLVRLPRRPGRDEQEEKLQRWLPALGPHLPLAVPIPIAKGNPSEDFPERWSIYSWIEGEVASIERINDPVDVAITLGRFITALQRIDTAGGPSPGSHNFFRGAPLAARDEQVQVSIEALRGAIDVDVAIEGWRAALQTPAWHGRPVWIHGDLKSDNLLILGGSLVAVIDFGGLCVGDPASDLIIAWDLFTGESRDAFRDELRVDDATWARGRGWALYVALTALPYYASTNRAMVRYAERLLAEAFGDCGLSDCVRRER